MDPTMQQAVSETTQESPDPVTMETNGEEEAATNGEAEKTVTSAPVPTYDQSFPSLGGPGAGGDGAAPATPFGRWNAKPRVQSSTITQVGVNLLWQILMDRTLFLIYLLSRYRCRIIFLLRLNFIALYRFSIFRRRKGGAMKDSAAMPTRN